jgi:hypothetical protein
MPRNPRVLIAVLTLVVIGASSAQAERPKCYNSQTCFTECMKSGIGRKCEKGCLRQASMLPPCK